MAKIGGLKMKYFYCFLTIFGSTILFYNGSFWIGECQFQTGDLIKERVEVSVDVENNQFFKYRYIISNSVDAEQKIEGFDLLLSYEYLSEDMRGRLVIDTESDKKKRSFLWDDMEEFIRKEIEIKLLREKYENKKPYRIPILDFIKQGENRSVDILVSRYGMPSVIDYYAEGEARIKCYCSKPYCGEEVEAQYGGNYPGYSDLTPYGPGKVGKTIGPGIYPEDLNGHISKLKDEIKKSYGIGWIKDSESRDSLINMLISVENTFRFKKNRTKVIDEVIDSILEMKENSQIKDEVYQMLRAHLIYLRGKK
jgi:hypothetical protein